MRTHPSKILYICLRRINKEIAYLLYFPENKKRFAYYKTLYNQLIVRLHSAYMNRYIWKADNTPDPLFEPHLYNLHHRIHLPSIRTNDRIEINKQQVNAYIAELDPECILQLLA